MSKRPLPPMEAGRIRLRLLEEPDLSLTLAWRNQEHIRKWFFHSDLLTRDQHRGWYQRYRDRDDDFVFVIEEVQRHYRPVGQLALYNIDWDRGKAEFGRLMIGEPDAAGKGLAREATALLVHTALADWGLREVYLEVLAENKPAVAVYASCGFVVTGRHDNVLSMSTGWAHEACA